MQRKCTVREREREHVLHEHGVVFVRIAVSIPSLTTRCFSCVLSCISLPLAAGSLLFSGSPLLGDHISSSYPTLCQILSALRCRLCGGVGRLGSRKIEKTTSGGSLTLEPNIEAAKPPQGLISDLRAGPSRITAIMQHADNDTGLVQDEFRISSNSQGLHQMLYAFCVDVRCMVVR